MSSQTQSAQTQRAVLALLGAAAIWGTMFPIAKHVLGEMDALTMTLLRYGLAAPIFLGLLARREGLKALWPGVPLLPLLGIGGLGFAGFNLLMFYGVGQTKPEHGAIVMALQPLIAAMIVWAKTGQRPAAHKWHALFVAIAGVILLVSNGDLSRLTDHGAVLPTLMMIAGGACWVLYSMGVARYPNWSSLRYTALTGTAGALVLAALWLIVGLFGGLRLPSLQGLQAMAPSLGYMIALAAIIAVLCWNQGIRHIGPQSGMLFINVVPLTALFVGLMHGQEFGRWELVGAVLVLGSLVLNQVGFPWRRGAARHAPAPALSLERCS